MISKLYVALFFTLFFSFSYSENKNGTAINDKPRYTYIDEQPANLMLPEDFKLLPKYQDSQLQFNSSQASDKETVLRKKWPHEDAPKSSGCQSHGEDIVIISGKCMRYKNFKKGIN